MVDASRGAAAPVVSAHVRACEFEPLAHPVNEPMSRSGHGRRPNSCCGNTRLKSHRPWSSRGACRTREPPGALPLSMRLGAGR
jgi:hypothetical protein